MRAIVISSSLFLLPFFYSIQLRLYFFSVMSGAVYICSVNYWRDPIPGWRHSMDCVVARSSFLITMGSCVIFVKYPMVYHCAISSILAFITYTISCKLYERGYPIWYLYHIGMHMCVTYTSLVGLYALNERFSKCIE